jgi:hypothetical protein
VFIGPTIGEGENFGFHDVNPRIIIRKSDLTLKIGIKDLTLVQCGFFSTNRLKKLRGHILTTPLIVGVGS